MLPTREGFDGSQHRQEGKSGGANKFSQTYEQKHIQKAEHETVDRASSIVAVHKLDSVKPSYFPHESAHDSVQGRRLQSC